jgi:signal transduction histidine kinase
MRDLSLHILDLVQNAIEAGASEIQLEIEEDTVGDTLCIRLTDNGRGMSPDELSKVKDPFITTRTTRKVGLGLSLLEMSTQRCDGSLTIDSAVGPRNNGDSLLPLQPS